MELFRERGFDGTSVAEIAERAGLTERTFFRHFADKREVLFVGGDWVTTDLRAGIADAPADATPLEVAEAALSRLADAFEERREFSRTRHAVIDANPELMERERRKLALLADSVADGLRERGVDETRARLASEVGMAVFRTAYTRWATSSDGRTARAYLREAFAQAKAL